jgi:hypothetical protein
MDELVYGFETYVYYDRARLDTLDRVLATFLDGLYMRAVTRLGRVRSSAAFQRRCERLVCARHARETGACGDAATVLFTFRSRPGPLPGPDGFAVTSLLDRYRIAASRDDYPPFSSSGASLYVAPRWFHEVLAHRSATGGDSGDMWSGDIRLAGLSPAFPREGVDTEELLTLWDPDPSHVFFNLGEILPALGRL